MDGHSETDPACENVDCDDPKEAQEQQTKEEKALNQNENHPQANQIPAKENGISCSNQTDVEEESESLMENQTEIDRENESHRENQMTENQLTETGSHVNNDVGGPSEEQEDKDGPSEKQMPCTSRAADTNINGDANDENEESNKKNSNKNNLNKVDEPSSSCYNEGYGLPIDQWAPSKKLNRPDNDIMDSPSPRRANEKRRLSFEEIVTLLEDKIKILLLKEDFTGSTTRSELKVIQRQTRYSTDVVLSRRLVEKITKFGMPHVFLRVWKSVNGVDYMSPEYYLAFKNLQTCLSIIWNCSDKSAGLCEVLVRCGVLQLFLHELSTSKYRNSKFENEDELYLVKAYLGILHNIVRLCSESRLLFRNSNAVPILRSYLSCCQGLVKTKAYLILSYIIDEHENSIINATDNNIAFILSILSEALESENHFCKTYAFWASEIACGLNHLAVNDANKVRIVHLGAIPLYLKLLQSENVEEQNLGAAGLWILSFKDENKSYIRDRPDIMHALQSLATTSPQEGIRRAARGALWVLRSASEKPPTQHEDPDIPHVMISYQWSSQQIMNKVKTRLRAAGYKVWMDIDNMSGSTLEAMALAVENSAVILICMSQDYKDSPSCRTEAEYTYRLRKDVIPVLMQSGYVPDGWLGMLVGTRLHIDLTSEELLDAGVSKLIRELGNRGRLQPTSLTSSIGAAAGFSPRSYTSSRSHRDTDRESDELHDLSMCSSTSSLHSYVRIPSAQNWTSDDVAHWFQSQQLSHISDRLGSLTGDLLLQYKKMMNNAPEYFYSSLERQLHLDLVSALRFAKALDALK